MMSTPRLVSFATQGRTDALGFGLAKYIIAKRRWISGCRHTRCSSGWTRYPHSSEKISPGIATSSPGPLRSQGRERSGGLAEIEHAVGFGKFPAERGASRILFGEVLRPGGDPRQRARQQGRTGCREFSLNLGGGVERADGHALHVGHRTGVQRGHAACLAPTASPAYSASG